MSAEDRRTRVARAIWHASRADEGTISATGANHVAAALDPIIDELIDERLEVLTDEMRTRYPGTSGYGVGVAEGWLDAADYIDPRVPRD